MLLLLLFGLYAVVQEKEKTPPVVFGHCRKSVIIAVVC